MNKNAADHTMNTVILNHGVQMPLLGYGTYQEGPGITQDLFSCKQAA